jgi:[acyl-carrier-protein] S-malonyltransferase
MAAVLGLENSVIEQICKDINIQELGFVLPANYNYPGQVVVSGEEKSVEKLAEMANEKGARKTILLNTDGPFHTNKLEKAKVEFEKALNNIKIGEGRIPVIKNIDGLPYNEKEIVNEILANHMVSPVRFDKTIEYMLNKKIDTFIEIGPGKTLTGFIRKVSKDVNLINIETASNLHDII